MENRLIIDQTTNTLIKCTHIVYGEKLDYLFIPHQYKEMHIDRIGPHCFNGLIINYLCIEDGLLFLA